MNNGSLILGGPENGKWIDWRGIIYGVIVRNKNVVPFSPEDSMHLDSVTTFTYRQSILAGGHTVFIPLSWDGPDQQELVIKALLNLASA